MAEIHDEGLMSRLPAEPRGGPDWLVGLRRDAASTLRQSGFPTRKMEAWRFTPVRSVTSVPFEPAAIDGAAAERWAAERLGDDGTSRLFLVNGRPRLDAAAELPEGVVVEGLAGALARDPESLREILGRLAPAQFFAALNQALFEDGLVLRIAEGVRLERPVHVVHVAEPGSTPTAAYPRVVVIAGEGSQARLVESYLVREGEAHLTNAVTEVVVEAGASLDHVRVQLGAPSSRHLASLAVRQARDSRYASRVVTLGGGLARLELSVALAGEGAECTLDGLYHGTGDDHLDHQTFIDHVVPRCTSRESYRGILDGRARGVFNGIIVMRPDAQQSSAQQENRNLLLSDDAVVNTKPHLEIEADDVTASHGATIGALDDASMFYLRSRGISEELARDILTFAFVHALIDRIPHRPVARRLGEALLDRMPNGDAIRELLE